MDLILLALLCYLNGRKARLKGLPVTTWVLFTVLGYIVATVIGVLFVLGIFYPMPNTQDPEVMRQDLLEFFLQKPIHAWFITACGVGGYLFVRYRIEKKQPAQGRDLPPE